MKPKNKSQALIGVPVGLIIMGGAAALYVWNPKLPDPVCITPAVFGLCAYIWGCVNLAKARGYNSLVVLTAVFGLAAIPFFESVPLRVLAPAAILGLSTPVVILFSLRDRNRSYRSHKERWNTGVTR